MKNVILGLSAVALMAVSGTAGATTYRAAGVHTFSGMMDATVGGTPMKCNTTIQITVSNDSADGHTSANFEHALASDPSHGHTAAITGMTLSGGPLNACALAKYVSGSAISYVGGNLQASSVVVNGPFGVTCSGNINVPYNHGAKTITFAPGSMLGSCAMSGVLTSTTLDVDATP